MIYLLTYIKNLKKKQPMQAKNAKILYYWKFPLSKVKIFHVKNFFFYNQILLIRFLLSDDRFIKKYFFNKRG